MHVVVEGQLVPFFRHFQQVVLGQQGAHDARLARCGAAKIVRQLELAAGVAVGAHEVLHDLDEHARRVAAQARLGAVQHFVAQGLQGQQAVFRQTGLQRVQQIDHRVGHA
ncbi:hypothetical protein [Nitratidesulfovibrio liaohensis]|uniref:Uncharacterized protein n=1 Tax=Nitratidesulfovibrio liaohensis TaxID=2604158 RepID=A0ABY9R509_9BACT|nr:hypothetical protein [Nitratidesulfovibrio liaohensis]WMW66821.1 hypothetical protein KPS_001440 [Nitratidesulfovibrio liaohensis]